METPVAHTLDQPDNEEVVQTVRWARAFLSTVATRPACSFPFVVEFLLGFGNGSEYRQRVRELPFSRWR